MNNKIEPYHTKSESHIRDLKDNISSERSYHSEPTIKYSESSEPNVSTNLSPNLAKLFKNNTYPPNEHVHTKEWEPPEKSGLDNCNIIIPNYYIKSYDEVLDIEYMTIIKDDIKNFRPLTFYQLEYIKTLPHEEKNKLFDLFNDCIQLMNEIINE